MKKKKGKTVNIATRFLVALLLIGVSIVLRKVYLKYQTTTDNLLVEKPLHEEAEKNLSDYEYMVNLDTMEVIWIKEDVVKLLGYNVDEVINFNDVGLIDERYGKSPALARIVNRMNIKEGVDEAVIKKKDGSNLKVNVTYKIFTFDEGGYMVGKINSFEPVSDEEAERYYSE